MSTHAEDFRAQVQQKIRNLVAEFSAGQISREQFNILYERYIGQLRLTQDVMDHEDDNDEAHVSTIAIRRATAGHAVGMGVYHHRSGLMIETMGAFDLPPSALSGILNELLSRIERREYIKPLLKRAAGGLWLVFIPRRYTTTITVFRNEPSAQQIEELDHIQHDFEEANRRLLDVPEVDTKQLALPFMGLVRKKLKS